MGSVALRRGRIVCVHRWRLPDAGSRQIMSRCSRCGARRKFPLQLSMTWAPVRLPPDQLREANENIRAAEGQALIW